MKRQNRGLLPGTVDLVILQTLTPSSRFLSLALSSIKGPIQDWLQFCFQS